MAAISATEPIPPSPGPSPRDQREQQRPAGHYGAAATHREMVQEKLRVDPATLAQRQRQPDAIRQSDPPRESVRDKRLAAERVATKERPGARVDIRV